MSKTVRRTIKRSDQDSYDDLRAIKPRKSSQDNKRERQQANVFIRLERY